MKIRSFVRIFGNKSIHNEAINPYYQAHHNRNHVEAEALLRVADDMQVLGERSANSRELLQPKQVGHIHQDNHKHRSCGQKVGCSLEYKLDNFDWNA
jgi:hypothetical protein